MKYQMTSSSPKQIKMKNSNKWTYFFYHLFHQRNLIKNFISNLIFFKLFMLCNVDTFHIMALPFGTKNGIEVADPALTIIWTDVNSFEKDS